MVKESDSGVSRKSVTPRFFWWVLATLATVLICIFLQHFNGSTTPLSWVSYGLLAADVFVLGRVALPSPQPTRWDIPFIAIMTVALGIGVYSFIDLSTLMCVVFPMAWVVSRTFAQAIVANIVITLTVFLAGGLGSGLDGDPNKWLTSAITAGLSLTFSLVMGTWLLRVTQWGEEKQNLLEKLSRSRDEMALVNHEAGAESERFRIAADLHDTVAQDVAGVVLLVQQARRELRAMDSAQDSVATLGETLSLIEETARDALTQVRGFVATTLPVEVTTTLEDALRQVCHRIERETSLEISVEIDEGLVSRVGHDVQCGTPDGHLATLSSVDGRLELDTQVQQMILRCAQEALTNVHKHARARHAVLSLQELPPDKVRLVILDDGVGIDQASERPGEDGGFGLVTMHQRARLIGGNLTIENRKVPLRGTQVSIVVPKVPSERSPS